MKINIIENFTINDFVLVKDINEYLIGQLTFHKFTVKNAPFVEIYLHENIILQDYIARLFDYLIWLGTKSDDVLIKHYNKKLARSEVSQVNLNWFIELECVYIKIKINEDDKINCTLHCIYRGNDIDITLTEKEIITMGHRISYS